MKEGSMSQLLEVHKATVDPANAAALVALRPRLIDAVRAACPGFAGATLVRLDEQTWLDVIEWESAEASAAAREVEAYLPEAAELFSLIQEQLSADVGEIVDRR
jgi:hypothetical protein